MLASYFRQEVEIWPFCACTMKNMQYNSSVIVDSAMGQIHVPQNVFLVDYVSSDILML